jgi:hypothetical protein
MNILAIGNSFSQDATRYLYGIAKKQGYNNFHVTNLCIGGCSLSTHYKNMLGDISAYGLEVNGMITGYHISIKEALLSRDWDVITIQQVSNLSPDYSTFEPYLTELCKYLRSFAPKAKLYLQETWAYEKDSTRLFNLNMTSHVEMYEKVHASYLEASKHTDGVIPSGTLFMNMLHSGIEKIHRDAFHATFGLGRYALGLLWLHILTVADISENSFDDFDEPISEEEIAIAKKCVMAL